MKYTYLFFLVFIFLFTSCNKKFEYSEIDIVNKSIKIDKQKVNESILVEIEIKNPSESDLQILGIKPSCNCTLIEKDKFTVKANSTYMLPINYQATELGNHSEKITIKSNTKPPFSIVTIESNVVN